MARQGIINAAIEKCTKNGHTLVDPFDIKRVTGGKEPTPEFAKTFIAQCSKCKALLRYYGGRFMGEAYQTTCASVLVIGGGTSAIRAAMTESEYQAQTVEISEYEKYSLNQWRDTIHQYAIDKGWWDKDQAASRNFGDLIALLHTELSEAYEDYRNGHGFDEVWYEEDAQGNFKPQGIPTELIDVMIRLFDLFGYYKIDVSANLIKKHAYNLTRPYRHGGKVS